MNRTRRWARYLWLAPVGALLVLAGLLARSPQDARFRTQAIALFEQAERVELRTADPRQAAVVIPREDRRRFRALLHGLRSSWVTVRCPAEADVFIDIYLPASGAERPTWELRHACYHTTCGQLTLVGDESQPPGRALKMGPAFRGLVPKPARPSPCAGEYCTP